MFMGLDLISDYVPDLQSNPEMFAFLERYASMGFASVLRKKIKIERGDARWLN